MYADPDQLINIPGDAKKFPTRRALELVVEGLEAAIVLPPCESTSMFADPRC